jgi:hypothetical protein
MKNIKRKHNMELFCLLRTRHDVSIATLALDIFHFFKKTRQWQNQQQALKICYFLKEEEEN